MCIVIATTAHPSYALIVIDNRDEFILRPTSRPHWWTSPASTQQILSARDLQRAEQGTWLGITKTGNFAVLTNYRETVVDDALNPVQGTRSRGAMVTAWLTANEEETTDEFTLRLLEGEGVKGVGGFSLLCGKLRRRGSEKELEPLVIISNRSEDVTDVPRIAHRRGEVYGLSNQTYSDPETWPKVKMGKEKVLHAVEEVVLGKLGEDELVKRLWEVLDTDTLPKRETRDFADYVMELRKSIFIPPLNGTTARDHEPKADEIASGDPDAVNDGTTHDEDNSSQPQDLATKVVKSINGNHSSCIAHTLPGVLIEGGRSAPATSTFDGTSGPYGTQRQTMILLDWEGNVKFIERSLFDSNGDPITRGQGDLSCGFKIEGFDSKAFEEEHCEL